MVYLLQESLAGGSPAGNKKPFPVFVMHAQLSSTEDNRETGHPVLFITEAKTQSSTTVNMSAVKRKT